MSEASACSVDVLLHHTHCLFCYLNGLVKKSSNKCGIVEKSEGGQKRGEREEGENSFSLRNAYPFHETIIESICFSIFHKKKCEKSQRKKMI